MTRPRPPRPPHQPGDRGPCATAASVAGLAREVEAARRALTALTGLAGLPARVDDLAALVARLAEDAAAAVPVVEPRPQPSWLALPGDADPADAADLLLRLAGWVGAVWLRYPDAERALPGCWPWHPWIVEELLWLSRAWHAAYAGPKSSSTAVGDWHDRLRPGAARRIRESAGTCSVEQHQPGRDRVPGTSGPCAATGGRPATEVVEPIAFWWAVNRDAEPPAPTPEQLAAAAAADRPRSRR